MSYRCCVLHGEVVFHTAYLSSNLIWEMVFIYSRYVMFRPRPIFEPISPGKKQLSQMPQTAELTKINLHYINGGFCNNFAINSSGD